jgi:hypothetical protein
VLHSKQLNRTHLVLRTNQPKANAPSAAPEPNKPHAQAAAKTNAYNPLSTHLRHTDPFNTLNTHLRQLQTNTPSSLTQNAHLHKINQTRPPHSTPRPRTKQSETQFPLQLTEKLQASLLSSNRFGPLASDENANEANATDANKALSPPNEVVGTGQAPKHQPRSPRWRP